MKRAAVLFLAMLICALCFSGCGSVSKDTTRTDSTNKIIDINGELADGGAEEIRGDSFMEKLLSFGLTEEEAAEARDILIQCGIPTIDNCEPLGKNTSIDGLICFIERLDDDRTIQFTMENRHIFYVGVNGEDLYDADNGGRIGL